MENIGNSLEEAGGEGQGADQRNVIVAAGGLERSCRVEVGVGIRGRWLPEFTLHFL